MNNSTTEKINPEKYAELFAGKESAALEKALDIRKFEIDLYWKRATYFWTFIGVTFAGYFAIQTSNSLHNRDILIVLSCLGMVFSWAWFCVNRGSKFWQENWEKHVDNLEDKTIGPLYKIILSRNTDDYRFGDKLNNFITGPSQNSVSKINQIISLYMTILWCILLFYSLPPFKFNASVNIFYLSVIFLTILTCISFVFKFGKSYTDGSWHVAKVRKSRIKSNSCD